ncbi:Atxe2 family lasso peptide isopeptidase [Luteimonas sp. SDU101]|uniref:Atxe2 family lasso peptide isopeptidase n=1 Tax=Luteimonas sp. SDU101 TaxID=3422593 RepID=UPI003EC1190E
MSDPMCRERNDSRKRYAPLGSSGSLARGWFKPVALYVLLIASCSTAGAHVVSPRQLVEVVDFGNPVVSPDGTHVAFRVELASIERNTYDTVWYVQRVEAGAVPRRVAEGGLPLRESWGLPEPTAAVWSPDGRWIYFRALFDGRVDVWRAATDGTGASAITRDPSDVRAFSLAPGGNHLYYSVGPSREEVEWAEMQEYFGGIRIDSTVPLGQGVFRSGHLQGRPATQRLRDNEVIRHPLLAGMPERWLQLDLEAGSKQQVPAGPPGPPAVTAADLADGLPEPWKLIRDNDQGRVALLTRQDGHAPSGPKASLSVLPNVRSRRITSCMVELCRNKPITGIQWRPGAAEVVFTTTDPEQSRAQAILRWNVETGEVTPVASSTGLLSGGRDPHSPCGLSSTALVCVTASAAQPPRLEMIDLESGIRTTLFDPNERLARDMVQMPLSVLAWEDPSGHAFNGIYYPAAGTHGTPPPLFITYYRCSGFVRGGVGDEWPLATFASSGIATLCINAAPTRADAHQRYELARSAVESVVDLLAGRGDIDRTRVGMGGLSFGSEATLWTMMNSDVLSAASVSSPAMTPLGHLFFSLHGEAFNSRLHQYWQLADPDETPDRWRMLSPPYSLDRMRTPVLMQMAEQEYLHAADYAIPLVREHRADLYVYPNEAHQKFQPRHKLAVYERNLDWFRFWLLDVESADSTKADQYSVWRTMRSYSAAGGSSAGNPAVQE